jgi:hypothetical protein
LSAANGNGKRFANDKGNQGWLFHQTCPSLPCLYMKELAEAFLTMCDTKLRNSTQKKKGALLEEQTRSTTPLNPTSYQVCSRQSFFYATVSFILQLQCILQLYMIVLI